MKNELNNESDTITFFHAIYNTNSYIEFINSQLDNPHLSPDIKLDLAIQRSRLSILQVKQYQIMQFIFRFTRGYSLLEKLSLEYIRYLNNELISNRDHTDRNIIQKIYHTFLIGREILLAQCILEMQDIITTAPFDDALLASRIHRAQHIEILMYVRQDDVFEDCMHMCNFVMIALDTGCYHIIQELIEYGVVFTDEEAIHISHKLQYMREYIGEQLYIHLSQILSDDSAIPRFSIVDVKMYLAYRPYPILLLKDRERRKPVVTVLDPIEEIIQLKYIEKTEAIPTPPLPELSSLTTAKADKEEESKAEATDNKATSETKSLETQLEESIKQCDATRYNQLVTENTQLHLAATEHLIFTLLAMGHIINKKQDNTTANISCQGEDQAESHAQLFKANRTEAQQRTDKLKERLRAKLIKRREEKTSLAQDQPKGYQNTDASTNNILEEIKFINFIESADLCWYNLLLILMHSDIIPSVRNAALRKTLKLNIEGLHLVRHFCGFDSSYTALCTNKEEEEELGTAIRTKMEELDVWKTKNPEKCLAPNVSLYNYFAEQIETYAVQFIMAFPTYSNGLIPKNVLEGKELGIVNFVANNYLENFMHILARNCSSERALLTLLQHIKNSDPNGIIISALLVRDFKGYTVITILETEKSEPWVEAINCIYDMFLNYILKISKVDRPVLTNVHPEPTYKCTLQDAFSRREDLYGNMLERNAITSLFKQHKYLNLMRVIDTRENFRKYLEKIINQQAQNLRGLYKDYLGKLFGSNEYVSIKNEGKQFLALFIIAVQNITLIKERAFHNDAFRDALRAVSPVAIPQYQQIPLLAKAGKKIEDSALELLHADLKRHNIDINLPTEQGFRYLDLCIQSGDMKLVQYVCENIGAEITLRSIFLALEFPKIDIYQYLWNKYIGLLKRNSKSMQHPREWKFSGNVDLVFQAVARSPVISPLQNFINMQASLEVVYPSRQNVFNIIGLRLALAEDNSDKICCIGMLHILLMHFVKREEKITEMLLARNSFGFSAIDFLSIVNDLPQKISDMINIAQYSAQQRKPITEIKTFLLNCDCAAINALELLRKAATEFNSYLYSQVTQAHPEHRPLGESFILQVASSTQPNLLAEHRGFFLCTKISYILAVKILRLEHLPAKVKGAILENVRLNYSNYEFAMFILHVDLTAMIQERLAIIENRELSLNGSRTSDDIDTSKTLVSETYIEEKLLLTSIEKRIEQVNTCSVTHDRICNDIEKQLDKLDNQEECSASELRDLLQYAKYRSPKGTTLWSVALKRQSISIYIYQEIVRVMQCDIRQVNSTGLSILQDFALNLNFNVAPLLPDLWDRVIDFNRTLSPQTETSALVLEAALSTDYFGNSWLYSLFAGPANNTGLILETLRNLNHPLHKARTLLLSMFIPNQLGYTAWYKLETKKEPGWHEVTSYIIQIIPQLALEASAYLPEFEKRNPSKLLFFKLIDFTTYPLATCADAEHLINIIYIRYQIRIELASKLKQHEAEQASIDWLCSFFGGQELSQEIDEKFLIDHLRDKISDNLEVLSMLEKLMQMHSDLQSAFGTPDRTSSLSAHRVVL